MFLRTDRRAGVDDARRRDPGRFDDHLDFRVRAGLGTRGDERGLRDPYRIPADGSAGGTRPLRVEIGDDRDLDTRHPRRLRQKHRAELAGPNQPDPYRPARGGALLRQAMEVHEALYSAAARYPRA